MNLFVCDVCGCVCVGWGGMGGCIGVMCVCANACICIPLSLSLTTIMALIVSTSGYVLRITMHTVAVSRPAPQPNWKGNSSRVGDHTKSP